MNEVQESVTSRFGPKTRVAFTTSPGYASMPPALQFVYAMIVLLTNGELTAFHRLIKYGEPLSMGKAHPSTETYSYKSTAGLKTLLVEYLLMQNRYLTGEEKNPKTKEEWKEANGGMPLLTDLCLAIRSDPLGMIRGLEEVVTCIYGLAVTYAFPDPRAGWNRAELVRARKTEGTDERNSALREGERSRTNGTQLPGAAAVQNGGGGSEGSIEVPKFWNLNPLAAGKHEVLRIPAWKGSFDLVKRELETILERENLPTVVPELPIVRRMTLGMISPLMVPSLYARAMVEKQQQEFTDGWDPLFIGYTAAVYLHTCDIKINSWTTQAKKMRGSMPPKFEVRDILRTLNQANLENMLPVWDDGRMIVTDGHIALKYEMKFATRKYRAPYGLERVEMKHEEKELDAAGSLYVALTEHKKLNPATPSLLSVGTSGDKRSGPVENRFRDILEKRRKAWMRLSVKQERK